MNRRYKQLNLLGNVPLIALLYEVGTSPRALLGVQPTFGHAPLHLNSHAPLNLNSHAPLDLESHTPFRLNACFV